MEFIEYNKNLKKIYIFKDWKVSILNIDTDLVAEIKLNFKFLIIEKITFFKHLENDDSFTIVGRDFNNIYYLKFDVQGNLVSKEILSDNKNDILLEKNNQGIIENLYSHHNYSYESNCKIFKNSIEIINFNLLEECKNEENDWVDYEYIECLRSTNQPDQLAFIVVHANYGVQGVKIFQINSLQQLDLIYDMDNLTFKGAFHNLTFNAHGDKFIVLLYERDNNSGDYFSICEYSIKNSKNPLNIHKTKYGYWNFHKLYTYYLTNSIVCIVRNSDLIIFDLTNSKTMEILNRDLNSKFFIDFNIVIYQFNSKIIVLEY